jgi:hypothetical protein
MFARDLLSTSVGSLPRPRRAVTLSGALAATLAVGVAAPNMAAAHKAASKSVSLHSGTLTLKFTAAAFAALTKSTTGSFANTRTVTAVAPGAVAAPDTFKFPLSSGKVNVQKLTGKVASKGGIDFVHTSTLPIFGSSTTQFDLTTFALHFGGALPVLSATFVGSSTSPGAPLATLSTSHVKHSKHGRAVTISGVSLKLTSAGVQVLNGQDSVFKVGQVIGTASVSAKT